MGTMVLRARLDAGQSWDGWSLLVRSAGGEIDKQWMRGSIMFIRFWHDRELLAVKKALIVKAGHMNFSLRSGISGY